jgi:hypothetical protein
VRLPKLCAAVAQLAGIDREIPRGDELYDYVARAKRKPE